MSSLNCGLTMYVGSVSASYCTAERVKSHKITLGVYEGILYRTAIDIPNILYAWSGSSSIAIIR